MALIEEKSGLDRLFNRRVPVDKSSLFMGEWGRTAL